MMEHIKSLLWSAIKLVGLVLLLILLWPWIMISMGAGRF